MLAENESVRQEETAVESQPMSQDASEDEVCEEPQHQPACDHSVSIFQESQRGDPRATIEVCTSHCVNVP